MANYAVFLKGDTQKETRRREESEDIGMERVREIGIRRQ